MIAISSRSQQGPAWPATYLARWVKSTALLIPWRFQFSLPVNCASSAGLSVFVMMASFLFCDPHGGGGKRHAKTPLERRCHSFLGETFRGNHKASLIAKRRRLKCTRPVRDRGH